MDIGKSVGLIVVNPLMVDGLLRHQRRCYENRRVTDENGLRHSKGIELNRLTLQGMFGGDFYIFCGSVTEFFCIYGLLCYENIV